MNFLSILVAGIIGALSQNISDIYTDVETDQAKIETLRTVSLNGRENSADSGELIVKVPVSDSEMEALESTFDPSGFWKDINYKDEKRSGWDPLQHAYRVERLAIRYARTGDKRAREMARKATIWWGTVKPECSNWWYNEIGIPRQFCAPVVLFAGDLSKEEKEALRYILGRSSITMTGQNRVWLTGCVLFRGILEGDEALVREARDVIAAEMKVSEDEEGLQKDWSFHQHGAQLQFGNYGLSFAVTQCWWCRAFKGTELGYDALQTDCLKNYLEKGLARVLWNGVFDQSASGRQVFKFNQQSKAVCVEAACKNMGVSIDKLKGATYYPFSDFGIYRGKNWYASIRMQSSRIIGYECTNNENTRGWFSSDGALLVRRDGREYLDIAPVWNWRHIPGVTSWDDGTKPFGPLDESELSRNNSEEVGGEVYSNGRNMVAYMEYDRCGLKAHKAWFFFPDGIVCLGSGITMRPSDVSAGTKQVVTTLEQNRLNGIVERGDNWIRHNGTTYISLDGQPIVEATSSHKGSWGEIAPFYSADDIVQENLFEIYINHGSKPVGATYAYVVIPNGASGVKASKIARRIKVLENSESRMCVKIGAKKYSVIFSSNSDLKSRIENLVSDFPGTVGVAAISGTDTVRVNADTRFPMFSVVKFHQALAVAEELRGGRASFPDVKELLRHTLVESDNKSCDALFEKVAVPLKVNDYIHSLGVTDCGIAWTEAQQHEDISRCDGNWSTPMSAALLLGKFFDNSEKDEYSRYVWDLMSQCKTGENRIPKYISDRTSCIAHKTGTGGPLPGGGVMGVCDVASIKLKDGRHIDLAVFIKDASCDFAACEELIAKIAQECCAAK